MAMLAFLILAAIATETVCSADLYGVQYSTVGTGHFTTAWVRIDNIHGNITHVMTMDDASSSAPMHAVMTPDATALIAPASDSQFPGTHLHVYHRNGATTSEINYGDNTAAIMWDRNGKRLIAITVGGDTEVMRLAKVVGIDLRTKANESIAQFRVPANVSVYNIVTALDSDAHHLYVVMGYLLMVVDLGQNSNKITSYRFPPKCAPVVKMWGGTFFNQGGALLALTEPQSKGTGLRGNMSLINATNGGCEVVATLPLTAGSGIGRQATLTLEGGTFTVLTGPEWSQSGLLRIEFDKSGAMTNVSQVRFWPPCGSCSFAWIGYQADPQLASIITV